jgi:hypoxanthine-DNA glycosylase
MLLRERIPVPELETHPFGNFVPPSPKYMILGSFAGRQGMDPAYDWYYGTRTNQFWPILAEVYGIDLPDKRSRQDLLTRLDTAIADIIYQCRRRDGTNLDANLADIVYNDSIAEILDSQPIEKTFFTSRFVEMKFKSHFKALLARHSACKLVTLPSPSRRYAGMSKDQKIILYRALLPKL